VDTVARCASTTLAGGLRASTSGLDSEMATGPSCDFGGTALQAVVTVNGLSTPVTAIKFSAPSCSVEEREGGTVDDSADILARCATTTLKAASVRRRLTWFQGRRRSPVATLVEMRFRKPPP